MQNFLFNTAEFNRLYRCDFMNQSEWETYTVRRPVLGAICLTIGSVNFVTYTLCLIVIRREALFKNSCFKIMFLLGLIDIVALTCNSLITGGFMIVGSSYCLQPAFQYFVGTLVVGTWLGDCLTCFILAFNRCLDFWSPRLSAVLFEGKRTFFWYFVIFFYTFYGLFFTAPTFLNSQAVMWVFDPYILVPETVVPIDRAEYNDYVNNWNTFILIPGMFILYSFLLVSLSIRSRGLQQQFKYQVQIALQSVMVCMLVFLPGFLFILLQFIPTPPFVLYLALITLEIGNGSGGVVLLCLNRTIREEVLAMLYKPAEKSIVVVTVIQAAFTN